MRRKAKDTLTALEMNSGETEEFELRSGAVVRMQLVATEARVLLFSSDQCETFFGIYR